MGGEVEGTDIVYVPCSFWHVQQPVLTQIAHYRILHAKKLIPVSVLEVISAKHPNVYKSFIVMIDTPRSTEYKVLLHTEGKRSVGDTLEHLLLSLRQKLALPLGKSLYKFFTNLLLYSANTIFLNSEKIAKENTEEFEQGIRYNTSSNVWDATDQPAWGFNSLSSTGLGGRTDFD